MGFRIFIHAVGLVFRHLGDALRLSVLPYLLQFVVVIGGLVLLMGRIASSPGRFDPEILFVGALITLALLVASIWVAVGWHRYVLLDEIPGSFMARFNGNRILAYFGNSLRLALIGVVVFIVGGIAIGIFGSVASAMFGRTGVYWAIVPALIIYVPVAIGFYRLALILPASAVGKPIGLGDAWSATKGSNWTILAVVLLSVIAALVLGLPGNLLKGPLIWFGIAWQVAVGWIDLLVGVSILTTLYGHYIEKRTIE